MTEVKRKLIHVDAPHYCAGMIVSKRNMVTQAAPILAWAIGHHWLHVKNYLLDNGFKILETPIKP